MAARQLENGWRWCQPEAHFGLFAARKPIARTQQFSSGTVHGTYRIDDCRKIRDDVCGNFFPSQNAVFFLISFIYAAYENQRLLLIWCSLWMWRLLTDLCAQAHTQYMSLYFAGSWKVKSLTVIALWKNTFHISFLQSNIHVYLLQWNIHIYLVQWSIHIHTTQKS